MEFELRPLPYAKDALAPHISARTLDVHYEKHHRGYLRKLEGLIGGKPEAEKSLEEIVRSSRRGPVFENAAQVWNHTFSWESMAPGGGGAPRGRIAERIRTDFGSYPAFRARFIDTATGLFGSGYVWLHLDPATGWLRLDARPNANSPLVEGSAPILACDVWEHAYYLDYQNGRQAYVEAFLDGLVCWERAEERLRTAG
jgi:Fe-Mn family superoxide dismutase